MSFLEKITSSRYAELLYLVRGKNGEKQCWFYILVEKQKLPMFKIKVKSPHIDLTQYGEVLESGWGENPPDDVEKKIKEEYS